MGDDNQIKDLVAQVSRESLAQSLQNLQKETLAYDLEREFAATKKHRSFFVLGLTLVTVLALVFSAWLTVRIIERRSAQQNVDISSFEDLNLKDLLNVAKRTEDELAVAQRELIALERQQEDEVRLVQSAYSAELELIGAQRGSEADKVRSRSAALQRRDAQLAEIRLRYEPLIIAKQQQIEEISRRLAQYDSRMLEQAKANEEMLASERRLFELDRERLLETHSQQLAVLQTQLVEESERFEKSRAELLATLRSSHQAELREQALVYNPQFADAGLLAILDARPPDVAGFLKLFDAAAAVEADPSANATAEGSPEATPDEAAGSPAAPVEPKPRLPLAALILDTGVDVTALGTQAAIQASNLLRLAEALTAIPYYNSVPPALAQLRASAFALASTYNSVAELLAVELTQARQAYAQLQSQSQAAIRRLEAERQTLQSTLAERQSNLRNAETENSVYRAALEVLAVRSGDTGYVLEVGDTDYVIWLRPLVALNRPGRAWIVRNERSMASIRIEPDGLLYRGFLLELTGEDSPQIFDSVVLELDSATGRTNP